MPATPVSPAIGVEAKDWRTVFDERQRKEIAFAEVYAKDFAHGATGHNAMIVMARMAKMLDAFAVGQECHIP